MLAGECGWTPSTTDPQKQTVELRSADGSANVYQLMAAMIVSARIGFEMDNSLKRAEELYVSVNIHNDENKGKTRPARLSARQLRRLGKSTGG